MATQKDKAISPVNILLIDDTPAKLLTYEVMLAELGECLLKANSSEEALQILLKTDVALVLTDVRMPGMDGYEFATLLRGHPRFQATPLLFISASSPTQADLLRAYASGGVDYISAPVVPELLRAKVRVFLDLYRKQRELEELRNDLEARVAARTAELTQSEERYRLLVDYANDIVATLDLEFRFTSVNPAVERILGYKPDEIIGTPLGNYVPKDQLATHKAMLKQKLEGQDSTQYEMELAGKDRRRFTLEVNSKLMFDADAKPFGIHSISRDITERKQAEARQLVLIRELQHRTKNLLAVVQSLVTSTLARGRDLASANGILVGRLHALARAQEFVASGAQGGVPLRDLIEAELAPFGGRANVQGVPVVLGGAFAQHFALLIHELATNAAKYGALSVPDGRLHVAWQIKSHSDEPVLAFGWLERGGPPIEPPTKTGFGSELIAASLGAQPRVTYAKHGLEFEAEIPFSEIMRASK